MKFTGIAASLALAGAASAAVIPRDTTLSTTVDGLVNQVNNLLNKVEPAVSGAVQDVDGSLDLNTLKSELASIQSQLGGLKGLLPLGLKRDAVEGLVGTVEGTAAPVVNTAEGVAAPVVSTAEGAVNGLTSTTKRDIVSSTVGAVSGLLGDPLNTVESLTPLANNLCSNIESKVPLQQTIRELTALTEGVATYVELPLALVHL
ncbi:hypothetical protein PISL3812_09716 [Talaromyces islandicus]|uniref:Uncharacterized protein n=1 Tax=Talaromyces islandicus TaxID=28573 RepID=A0A0U1MAH8_TALIS|nr:hypothetical protein PISL3812_09716 [Talaromyces islandicus]